MSAYRRSSAPAVGADAPTSGGGLFGILRDFWTKLNNDWVLYLASLLAYNVLFSILPIGLVLVALTSVALDAVSADALAQFVANAIPGDVGQQALQAVRATLEKNVGPVLIVGVLSAIFFGSRLFIVIENCFGIIYRLPSRRFLPQNIMAIVMLLLYIVLVPVVFVTSTFSAALARLLIPGADATGDLLLRLLGIATAFVIASVLFAAVYMVVPNERVRFAKAWKGTLAAAALLVLYQQIFPLYQSLFLQSTNLGSILGLAAVIVIFFYYIAFILLLGAEVNSWAEGQRATLEDLPTLLYDILRLHRNPTGTEPGLRVPDRR